MGSGKRVGETGAGRLSRLRCAYLARLAGRIVIFGLCAALCAAGPDTLDILDGWNFFRRLSPLHLLWIVWMGDMVMQLVPIRRHILPLGSQKLFRLHFRPGPGRVDAAALRRHAADAARRAYGILALWAALVAVIGALFLRGVIGRAAVFLISVFFYVCDLICVLIWCPFRLALGNRCCTTCRIFNWDHLMMFSPLVWLGGFFALSLAAAALAVWLLWEYSAFRHPERFWEGSNGALRCAQCTDKLCIQYCEKRLW